MHMRSGPPHEIDLKLPHSIWIRLWLAKHSDELLMLVESIHKLVSIQSNVRILDYSKLWDRLFQHNTYNFAAATCQCNELVNENYYYYYYSANNKIGEAEGISGALPLHQSGRFTLVRLVMTHDRLKRDELFAPPFVVARRSNVRKFDVKFALRFHISSVR